MAFNLVRERKIEDYSRFIIKLFLYNVAILLLIAFAFATYSSILERQEAALLKAQGIEFAYCGGSPLANVVELVFQTIEGPLGLGAILVSGLAATLIGLRSKFLLAGIIGTLALDMIILRIIVILYFAPIP